MSEARTLLVVDDDETFRERLVRAFTDRGLLAKGAGGVSAALTMAKEDSPELAVVDLRMPDGSGLDVVRELHAMDHTTSIVVLTGFGSIATALEAVRLGAASYLTKPATVDEILAAFDSATPPQQNDDEHVPSLARVEWEHIQRVMVHVNGNVSQAARLLGIHRRSLQRKLSKRPNQR
jgi:two-component system, response regulator RegA